MINHILKLGLMLAVALAPVIANAGFRVIDSPKAAVGQVGFQAAASKADDFGYQRGRPAVREYGESKGREIRHGFGKDLPLSLVFQQVAPKGWSVELSQDTPSAKLGSWQGGKPWTDVLVDVATSARVYADVDWERHKLSVTAPAAPQKVTFASAPAKANPQVDGKPLGATVSAEAVPLSSATPRLPTWTAKVGSTVRETVTEWATSQGWIVHWPMADLDYRIAAPLTFDGSLVDAVSKLTLLYEGAERPLAVNIQLTQRLIRFSEKNRESM